MNKERLYIFKVALTHDKKIWRRIEILGSQTLSELHEAIFMAFDRYEPHLYSFFFPEPGKKSVTNFGRAPEYTHPAAIEDVPIFGKKLQDATTTAIEDLDLKIKDKFKYLFDFGDEWMHDITLEKILDIFPDKDYPAIVKINGESPPQYQEYVDDYNEEWSDEDFDDDFDDDLVREIGKENQKILSEFQAYLEAKNLSAKTVKKHVSNIDFYINAFLLHDEPYTPKEGIHMIHVFLGYWFIRKALWASENSLKENITSLKHFYTFMQEKGEVIQKELDEMKQIIKLNKNDWLETVMQYNDPDTDFDDIW